MPLDRIAELRPQLAAFLAPGEEPRIAAHVQLCLGEDEAADAVEAGRREQQRLAAERLAAQQAPPEPPSALKRVGLGAAGAVAFGAALALGGSPFDGPMPKDRDLRGKVLIGAPGSVATRLRDLLDDRRGGGHRHQHYLVPTDRRVLVLLDRADSVRERALAQAEGRAAAPYEPLGELPASWIRSVTKAPRLLQRGRVRLDFWDGSAIVLDAFLPSHANALVPAVPISVVPPPA